MPPVTIESETSGEVLGEIKRAYVAVLHEKEEQIMQLKEEIVDLKTLVKILEGENERLKQRSSDPIIVDNWGSC